MSLFTSASELLSPTMRQDADPAKFHPAFFASRMAIVPLKNAYPSSDMEAQYHQQTPDAAHRSPIFQGYTWQRTKMVGVATGAAIMPAHL